MIVSPDTERMRRARDLHFNAESPVVRWVEEAQGTWSIAPHPPQFVGILSDLSEGAILYTPQVYQGLPVHLL